jgi:hypothetical protein
MKSKNNKLKTIKRQKKKHIISMSKLIKPVNQVSQASMPNMWTGLWTPLRL